jgi:hypothetical protein
MYEDLSKSANADLIDQAQTQKLASSVNHAILLACNQSADLKLEFYWKLMAYSQE